MGGLSQRRPESIGSAKWRGYGNADRNVEKDYGSSNGPKWPQISSKKNLIVRASFVLIFLFN